MPWRFLKLRFAIYAPAGVAMDTGRKCVPGTNKAVNHLENSPTERYGVSHLAGFRGNPNGRVEKGEQARGDEGPGFGCRHQNLQADLQILVPKPSSQGTILLGDRSAGQTGTI